MWAEWKIIERNFKEEMDKMREKMKKSKEKWERKRSR